jgi:restriction endonuclease S subunit
VATENVSKYKVVRPNALVYNVYLLWLGAIGRNVTGESAITSPVYEVFDVDGTADARYVEHLVRSDEMRRAYAGISIGTVPRRRRTPWQAFLQLPITLPPLAEQRRIVDLIAAVDDAIEAAEREAESHDRTLTALLAHEFSFDGVGSMPVIELIEFTLGGAWGSPPGADDVDVTALGPSAYKAGDTSVDPELGTLRSLSAKRAADRSLQEGDIVLERSGGSPTQPVGRVIRMEKDTDYVVPSDFMRLLRVDRSKADPAYVFWALWCAYRTGRSQPFQKRTTSIFNLNIPSYLAGLKMSVPAFDEQREIVALAEAGWSSHAAARAHADALRALRSNLLTVLLSGEHEIPATYDQLRDDDTSEGAAA